MEHPLRYRSENKAPNSLYNGVPPYKELISA